ncbi:MAG: SoxR reducing system RseC family protein [Prevotellaceae bacterium]|nr:SoxR reducing system RseC family protein [Prevotellaceae bacterium]
MNGKIKHQGIIDNIEDGCVKVRIIQTSACASCKVSGHCNASESKEKTVDVYNADTSCLHKGDNVIVVASDRTGFWAVMLSAVIPLILLVSVLLILVAFTGRETIAALIAMGSLIPYYFVIYLLRDKINTRFAFYIEPLNLGHVVT